MSGNKQSSAEMARVIQQLQDETLVYRCEVNARGILDNPDDPRHEEARQMLDLRPAIRRRSKQGLPYGDIMEQFWRLIEAARLKAHAAKSRKGKRRLLQSCFQLLAAEVGAWEDIPAEHYEALEIETMEYELKFYRDGNKVACIIEDGDGTRTSKLAKSTFERHYLRPALKSPGHIRR